MRTFTEIHKELCACYRKERDLDDDVGLLQETIQELLKLAAKVHNDEANVEISLNNAKKRRAI